MNSAAGEIFRGRAPLRIGLAGGGTDVSPYCDEYGGAVLNVTIGAYAYATILPSCDGQVRFIATDLGSEEVLPLASSYDVGSGLRLHRGVYNRIIHDFNGGTPVALTVVTSVDSPFGSGLGSSSALTVALVESFRAMFKLPLGEYDIAHLAFRIERVDIGLAGGRQDQYAATFGGMNFIEFAANDRVIVNPLPVRTMILNELESSTILYFTGASRGSAEIIDKQVAAMRTKSERPLEALHQLKREALELKAALLRGELGDVAEIFSRSWDAKKATAAGITNPHIEEVYEGALKAGALAGRISGAGGGGFMLFLVDPIHRERVFSRLREFGGVPTRYAFTSTGSTSWSIGMTSSLSGP